MSARARARVARPGPCMHPQLADARQNLGLACRPRCAHWGSITKFQEVITLDIEVDAITANMTVRRQAFFWRARPACRRTTRLTAAPACAPARAQAIGTFLDTAPAPATMLASANALVTRVDPDLKNALTDLGAQATAFGAFDWAATLLVIKNGGPSGTNAIGGMKAKADAVQAAINALGGP